jgi:hypothetical protein
MVWMKKGGKSKKRNDETEGKQVEARHMQADIANWFTEGFDTKDLQEAKALIEALSH